MLAAISLGTATLIGLGIAFAGSKNRAENIDDYISHRGKSGIYISAVSLAASVLGGWILFSPGETGSWAGISGLTGYALGQGMPLILLAFLGPYLKKILPNGFGLGDFVYKRYGKEAAVITTVLMVFYMATFLSAELTAIGQALDYSFRIPMLISTSAVMLLIFLYVFTGGLGASIKTDSIQLFGLIPLLLILFAASYFSLSARGMLNVTENINLISFSFLPGIKFGIVLFIGITASNLFHQGFWQRIYSLKESASEKKAFILGAVIVIPLVLIAGSLGIMAKMAGSADSVNPSLASFSLLSLLHPAFTSVIVILAVLLVMSSIDTLLNGLVSSMVSWRGLDEKKNRELKTAQILTVFIGVIAVIVGSRGYSVLYLFLLADLICSALAFPLLFGLFNKNINGREALISGFIGLVTGALFFPLPDFSSWSFFEQDMLYSFSFALILSAVSTLIFSFFARQRNEK